MTACPGENELLDFVGGELAGAPLDALHAHLAGCGKCERVDITLAIG